MAGVQNRDSVIMYLPETEFYFGQIKSGEIVTHSFNVINKGIKDLLIHQVYTTCGCSAASFDTTPIKPGGKGSVLIQFDSTGKSGQILKIATIISNCKPNNQDLKIKGYIID